MPSRKRESDDLGEMLSLWSSSKKREKIEPPTGRFLDQNYRKFGVDFAGIFRSAESNFERFLGPWNEWSYDDGSESEAVVSAPCRAKKFPRETNFRPISERHFENFGPTGHSGFRFRRGNARKTDRFLSGFGALCNSVQLRRIIHQTPRSNPRSFLMVLASFGAASGSSVVSRIGRSA